jgi:hypothetical protein
MEFFTTTVLDSYDCVFNYKLFIEQVTGTAVQIGAKVEVKVDLSTHSRAGLPDYSCYNIPKRKIYIYLTHNQRIYQMAIKYTK